MSKKHNPSKEVETEQERLNRKLDQLLGELRVAMPGVQVLFAFLLAVPFQQRFAQVTEFQKDVYFVTLLAAAAASALFVAPTAYHRLMFRERDKPKLVTISSQARPRRPRLPGGRDERRGAARHRRAVRPGRPPSSPSRPPARCSSGCGSCSGSCGARRRQQRHLMSAPTAILDVDGTLVDSNYQHALAWYRAFRLHGITLPVWRCHRAIGMGGDQLVPYLAGEGFDAEHGDEVRDAEHVLFAQMIAEVRPFEGARGLIEDLKSRGCKIVLASSAKSEDVAALHRPARRP